MKRNLHKTLLPLAVACATLGSAAQAQLLTINGSVSDNPCTLAVAGGGAITMPGITAAALPNVGSFAGETTFTINLTNCPTVPGQFAKIHFYNTTSGTVNNGRLNPSSGNGWQFQMLPATGTTQLDVYTNASPVNQANDPGVNISSGSGNVDYRIRYYRTGTLSNFGAASAQANMVAYYI